MNTPGRGSKGALGLLLLLVAVPGLGADLHSASVDRAGERIIVRGAAFNGGTVITLGGVTIPTANVTPDALDLPFDTDLYSAVQWRGSYSLVADGSERMSVYIDAPIEAPPPPPPPPPPPSGGPDCPCTAGWDATGINNWDFVHFILCSDGQDGTQQYISGVEYGGPWFFAAAFDPNNIYFDMGDPGNSVSFCAAHDGSGYTVAEPVTNEDQYWDCYEKLWVDICF